MRLTALRSIAVCSCLIVAIADAARRPHFGGSLRIETRAEVASLDPAEAASDSAEAVAKAHIAGQVFETLVRFDSNGEPQPMLATSWTHDVARRQWVFTPRAHVALHNGAPWPQSGAVLSFSDQRPIEDILRGLAKPESAVVVRTTDGGLAGTGPFRIAKWDARKGATLEANDVYWGGRPYLDQVDIIMGRSHRDQSVDFELGKADVTELPLAEVRRAQPRGGKIVTTAPVEVLALMLDNNKPQLDRLRDALAFSVDRLAIQTVLLQKLGDSSGALLPQWLTGYAFLFNSERNVGRARELAAGAQPLSFVYDRQNPLVRAIAERLVVNAAEAGLVLRPPVPGANADVRLITLRIGTADVRQALGDIAAVLRAPLVSTPAVDAANLYELERALVQSKRIIPLFHLPVSYQVGPAVRGWASTRSLNIDTWNLQDVWLDPRGKP